MARAWRGHVLSPQTGAGARARRGTPQAAPPAPAFFLGGGGGRQHLVCPLRACTTASTCVKIQNGRPTATRTVAAASSGGSRASFGMSGSRTPGPGAATGIPPARVARARPRRFWRKEHTLSRVTLNVAPRRRSVAEKRGRTWNLNRLPPPLRRNERDLRPVLGFLCGVGRAYQAQRGRREGGGGDGEFLVTTCARPISLLRLLPVPTLTKKGRAGVQLYSHRTFPRFPAKKAKGNDQNPFSLYLRKKDRGPRLRLPSPKKVVVKTFFNLRFDCHYPHNHCAVWAAPGPRPLPILPGHRAARAALLHTAAGKEKGRGKD
eukprot:gene25033-biopygen19470